MSIYKDKIKLAAKIIESSLSDELNWCEVSRECGISEYHFHRIFTSMMKETPGDFIIRRRLEKAISKLAYDKTLSLQDIAFESGYSSQSNFNKAFKAYYGVTPGQISKGVTPTNSKVGKIKSKYGKDFFIEGLYPIAEINNDRHIKEVKMKAQIKDFPERTVVFQSSKQGYIKESIHQTWADLLEKLAPALNKAIPDLEKFGVGHHNPQVTPLEKCRYDACVLIEVGDLTPPSMAQTTFPSGQYACFHYKGSSEKLLQFYLDIYKNWFSDNGYEPGDFPLIERYIDVDKDNFDADIELETQFLLK